MRLEAMKILQVSDNLPATSLTDYAQAVFLVPVGAELPAALPYGAELAQRRRRAGHRLADGKPFVTDLPNAVGTRVALVGVDPARDAFELLALARELVAAPRDNGGTRLALACYGLEPGLAGRACEALVAAALAAAFELPRYRSRPEPHTPLAELHIFGHLRPDAYARSQAEAKGNNLARYLTALPPNELSPASYRQRVAALARTYGWKQEFLDVKKLSALGAHAFLAVARGSPEPDAGILRLRYTPPRKSNRRADARALALVGKGICFDTGGTNLKSAKSMHGMHEDMEGSAVALGTLLALTELKVDFPVDCWLALARNHIGPRAYQQNEVIRAANGTTIEVVHTDAEGRLILADTLYFAARGNPRLIVDYATLTGACVSALSTRYSGVLTNRATWVPALIEAGRASGERVWPFPLDADYADALKSEIADIKQCTLDNDADHILAGVFLRKFIPDGVDWVHVDLSAGNHKGGLAHIPTDITGFGVRFSLNLLLDQKL